MEEIDLSFFFKTKNEALDFSKKLEIISEKIYSTNFDLDKVLSEQLGLQKKDKFLELLRENKIDISNNSMLKEFVEKIKERVSSLPVISLSIAFEPNDETLSAISEWFVLNVKKQAVFDIKVDQNVVAGAVIFYDGKFKDYSVRPKLAEIIKKTIEGLSHPSTPAIHQSTELITLGR